LRTVTESATLARVAILRTSKRAFGGPGVEPRWTQSIEDAIRTAYSSGSAIWFTVSAGVVNEIDYPTTDRPQIRDLQFVVTDGETFFHDTRRGHDSRLEPFPDRALGVRIISSDRESRYRIFKELITDPHQPALRSASRSTGARRRAGKVATLRSPWSRHDGRGGHGSLLRRRGRSRRAGRHRARAGRAGRLPGRPGRRAPEEVSG
jgi:glucoamylase